MSIIKKLYKLVSPIKVNSYWDALQNVSPVQPFIGIYPATEMQAEGNVMLSTGREIFRDEVLSEDADYVI